ncbi:MAG: NAD-dependent epimerase/dehydratase family protein [Endomicrobiales bacterium]|nr:NAD-dependent epimerase/dehydratase family protein [Endomicrobiales bacterium]
MRILVTGGAGFIGSNIVDEYLRRGHDVAVLDDLSTGKPDNLNKSAEFHEASILEGVKVRKLLESGKFNVINHHAAQIDVRKSVENPVYDANTNIIGTLNLLAAAKENGVKKVIFASSGGTIYGECPKKAPSESAKGSPVSPYGIAKYTIEFYMKFYSRIFGLKFTSLRYGNVYGPRQDPYGEAGVVAIFSQRILAGEEVNIYGNGEQTRDYVYVGDVVTANALALEKGDDQIINIGTSRKTSVNGLFKCLAEIGGYGKKPVYREPRAGELQNSFLAVGKAKRVLGWKPETSLEKGLEKTFSFFKGKYTGRKK